MAGSILAAAVLMCGLPYFAAGQSTATGESKAVSESKPMHLRVVDGRNGRPLAGEQVQLWYDEREGAALVVTTDADGVAALPPSLQQDPLRIAVMPMGSIDCRKTAETPVYYSLRTIAEFGLMAENRCGRPVVRKQRGEMVLFVRGKRWIDGFNQ